MKAPTDLGVNRTGIGTSPIDSKQMIEGVSQQKTGPANGEVLAMRAEYIEDSSPVGSVPPPPSLKGMAKAAVQAVAGRQPGVWLDKLGERLAFERTGTRLYELVLAKFSALGSWDGGPSKERLGEIYNEELAHFQLLRQAIEKMGADPTVQTPSADLVGVESLGILQVVADPRTTLAEALQAMLIAELADNDGWNLLASLADEFGQKELAAKFRIALDEEQGHLRDVRLWVESHLRAEATRAVQPSPG